MTTIALLLAFLAQDKIEWAEDLETALAQSEKDGRPVITYWTFDG